MTYSEDTDVRGRIAHVKIPSGVLVSSHREAAYTDINIQIRQLYTVPVNSTDQTDMDWLRDVEADLAGGTLLLDVATVNQISELHEFAMELIKRSTIKLTKLLSQNIVLIGAEKDTDSTDNQIDFPLVSLRSPDASDSFNRRPSGIDMDAREGRINTREYVEMDDEFANE